MSGLDLSRQAGRLSHAYILAGPAGEERRSAAAELAMAYVCTGQRPPCGACSGCRKVRDGIHPDVSFVGEQDKNLTVDMIRKLRADAYILPNEAPRKVYIIDRAETMNASVQNAMLKLLEDGPAYAAFLLLAEAEGALLPTIRSRCEVLRLEGLSRQAPDPELVEQSAALAGLMAGKDRLALLEYCVGLEKWDRDRLKALLDLTAEEFHRQAAQGHRAKGSLQRVALLRELSAALDFNVGAGHIAGWLCTQAQ